MVVIVLLGIELTILLLPLVILIGGALVVGAAYVAVYIAFGLFLLCSLLFVDFPKETLIAVACGAGGFCLFLLWGLVSHHVYYVLDEIDYTIWHSPLQLHVFISLIVPMADLLAMLERVRFKDLDEWALWLAYRATIVYWPYPTLIAILSKYELTDWFTLRADEYFVICVAAVLVVLCKRGLEAVLRRLATFRTPRVAN